MRRRELLGLSCLAGLTSLTGEATATPKQKCAIETIAPLRGGGWLTTIEGDMNGEMLVPSIEQGKLAYVGYFVRVRRPGTPDNNPLFIVPFVGFFLDEMPSTVKAKVDKETVGIFPGKEPKDIIDELLNKTKEATGSKVVLSVLHIVMRHPNGLMSHSFAIAPSSEPFRKEHVQIARNLL